MFKSLENMACEESFRALSLSNLTKGAIETVLQVSGAQKTGQSSRAVSSKHRDPSLVIYWKLSKYGRMSAWMKWLLLTELKNRKKVNSGSRHELPSRKIETLPKRVVMELGNQKLIWN